nr:CU044_5270 family protein [Actinomadura fibrosa]
MCSSDLAAIIVAQIGVPGRTGTASAAAAEVLRDAAVTARGEPPVAPGAYRYVRELAVYLSTGPASRQCNEAWFRPDGSMAGMAGGLDLHGSRCTPGSHLPRSLLSRHQDTDRRPRADVRALPTDPSALRKRLYSDVVHGTGETPVEKGPPDQLVFDRIGRLLRMALPPALRAALFQTLATVPGVDLVRGAGERDALGRRGIALVRSNGDAQNPGRLEIILTPGTYRYLGTKWVVKWRGGPPETYLTALLSTAVVSAPFQRP